ncbi:MAG: ATP-sensitive inward rectifier potassium channel 10 [Alphaproteobacteria bacterium]|nr:ATP-sensitive inward rectifier potassium channel 10 [Alphaproteobacteria bacterium]
MAEPEVGAARSAPRKRRRVTVIRGQDSSRWTDFYHGVLRAPWWQFILGLAAVFLCINAVFAELYRLDPSGIAGARPGSFADAFYFSIQTFGSIGYGVLSPRTPYANMLVTAESFVALVNGALATGLVFARFSRPFARVLFSNVAVIATFEGRPTLMFRAMNQRGNQILGAGISVSFARQATTQEGIVMRRFDELSLVRSRTPLFALSWTVMHTIDETSPLYGATPTSLATQDAELIALLSGTDDTLADTIYARHVYSADQILCGQRFVDVLSFAPQGRRIIDLHRFHDTEPDTPISAPSPDAPAP